MTSFPEVEYEMFKGYEMVIWPLIDASMHDDNTLYSKNVNQ